MGEIVRRLKRMILSAMGIGLLEQDDVDSAGMSALDNLKSDLVSLRTAVARVIANQYRIERLLSLEREKLSHTDAEIELAEGDDDLIKTLSLRKDLAAARVVDLEAQLKEAKQQSERSRLELEEFEDMVQTLTDTAKDARLRYQLASIKAQAEKFSFTGSRQEDILTIARIKEKADIAQAEADAIKELNEALNMTDRPGEV
jgi:phage shock protein A